MKVTLLTIGSRGDIQPFIALAQGLARAGHNVMLGGPPDFAELAASYQVPFTPIGVSMQTFFQDSTVKRAITGGGVLRFMRTRSARRAELYAQLNREALALCQGSDVIIYKNAVLSAFGIAQKLGISCAEVRLQPYTPTTAFPAFILKGRASYSALINWLSGFALQTVVWQILRNDVKAFWRDELRLPPLPSLWPDRMLAKAGARVFHPISPRVLPRPPGWPAHLHFTGYWFLGPPPGWSPPVELVRFLEAGEPPVYIGFGSMPNQEPRAAFALIARIGTQRPTRCRLRWVEWAIRSRGRQSSDGYRECAPRMVVSTYEGGRASWRSWHHRSRTARRRAERGCALLCRSALLVLAGGSVRRWPGSTAAATAYCRTAGISD